MPQDVVEQLPAHEGTKGKRMNWHERSGEWKKSLPEPKHGLPWTAHGLKAKAAHGLGFLDW